MRNAAAAGIRSIDAYANGGDGPVPRVTTRSGDLKHFVPGCVLLLLGVSACAAAAPPRGEALHRPVVPQGETAHRPSDDLAPYRLMPGDVVDVKLYHHPQLSDALKLRPDGYITLQLLGDVRASGLMPEELARDVQSRFAAHLPNAQTVVVVREFAAPVAYVGGEVTSPGPVSLLGGLTLSQAILMRGGPNRSAKLAHVLIVRHHGDGTEVIEADANRILRGNLSDVTLHPYDVIYLPTRRISQANAFVDEYINNLVPRALNFPVFLFRGGAQVW
jgi:polysaccharide biosynthesis/export protein